MQQGNIVSPLPAKMKAAASEGSKQDNEKIKDEILWEDFLQDTLLRDEIIDGVLLLTFNGKHAYSCGGLSKLNEYALCVLRSEKSIGVFKNVIEDDYSQFVGIFDLADQDNESTFYQSGFNLTLNKDGALQQKFVIRKKTFHSVYATSKRNKSGLVIINLPFGILITLHHHPITSAVASDFVEGAAELLRM